MKKKKKTLSLLNDVPKHPTRSKCPTCTRAQVYFTDWKIKKWKLCIRTFIRVLSLILGLNFAIS